MDAFLSFLSSHHLTLVVTIAAAVLIAYFIFKKLVKLALLCFLIGLGIAGYFYLKDPGRSSKDVSELWKKTKTKTMKVVETGKKTYEQGKDVYDKGRKFSESLDSLAGKGKENKSEVKE